MIKWRGNMKDVAETCGDDVARALLAALPGIYLYVPRAMTEEGLITRLDPAIADRLISAFGGDRIYVSDPRKFKGSKRAAVKAMREAGLTVQQIALELTITERRVYQILDALGRPARGKAKDPNQRDLFGDVA